MTTTPTDIPKGRQTGAAEPVPERPRVATGVELIGEYKDSGFKNPPYLVRRSDGQIIQLPRLLYLVAEAADGSRDSAQIGEHVSRQFGRTLEQDGVELLVDEKLRPLGVLAQADGSSPQLPKSDPLLALKAKTAVVPAGAVTAIARLFRPLFFPPIVVAVLGAFFALSGWLLVYHGVSQSLRQVFYDPLFILMLLGLVALSAAFHECGHATACHYGGAKPGTMGAGIYIVWPAFFTDVTDAYRLGKGGRLRTDLGGVYFNAIFTLATFGAYFLTGWEPLLIVVPLQIMEMLHQMLPFIRLDGYYVVGDLTGVPDMFARIKPTLKSLNPLSSSPAEVLALKPWVRGAVTFYVFTIVPLLVLLLGLTVMNAPRIVATAWDSLLVQNGRLHLHIAAAQYLHVAVDAIQMAVLVLPIAGLYATFWKLGRRVVEGTWTATQGRRLARALLVVVTALAVAFAGYTWLPNGDYRPIQDAEAGTLGGALQQTRSIRSGRPSLSEPRARELGGAPWHARPSRSRTPAPTQTQPGSRTGTSSTTTTTPTSTAPVGGSPPATTATTGSGTQSTSTPSSTTAGGTTGGHTTTTARTTTQQRTGTLGTGTTTSPQTTTRATTTGPATTTAPAPTTTAPDPTTTAPAPTATAPDPTTTAPPPTTTAPAPTTTPQQITTPPTTTTTPTTQP